MCAAEALTVSRATLSRARDLPGAGDSISARGIFNRPARQQARATLLRTRDPSGPRDPGPWCGAQAAAPVPVSPHAARDAARERAGLAEQADTFRAGGCCPAHQMPSNASICRYIPLYPAISRYIPLYPAISRYIPLTAYAHGSAREFATRDPFQARATPDHGAVHRPLRPCQCRPMQQEMQRESGRGWRSRRIRSGLAAAAIGAPNAFKCLYMPLYPIISRYIPLYPAISRYIPLYPAWNCLPPSAHLGALAHFGPPWPGDSRFRFTSSPPSRCAEGRGREALCGLLLLPGLLVWCARPAFRRGR